MVRIVSASVPGTRHRFTRAASAFRSFRGVCGIIALTGSALLLRAQGPVEPPSPECIPANLTGTATVGQYVFKAYTDRTNGNGCLEVLQSSRPERRIIRKFVPKVVFRKTLEGMGEFELGQPAREQYGIPKIENGADITGRGRANMIVTNFTGGAHCCFSHFIFEVEPTLWLLAKIDDGDGEGAHFADLDGNHHYYYVGNDWTFSYWNASFASSPSPSVILRFVEDKNGGGSYHLAIDKMQRPAPTTAEWNKALREAGDAFGESAAFGDGLGSELWSNMLNLIYTGHSDLAWKLFDQAWPLQKPGKDKFLSGFCAQLKTSPYWPDLAPTVNDAPAACVSASPASGGN